MLFVCMDLSAIHNSRLTSGMFAVQNFLLGQSKPRSYYTHTCEPYMRPDST